MLLVPHAHPTERSMEPKRRHVRHLPAAAAIAAGLCATWLLPQGLAGAIGTHERTVAPGEQATISTTDGSVTFKAPAGFTQPTSQKASQLVFTRDGSTVRVEALGEVIDADAAMERRRAAMARDGVAVAFTGAAESGGGGFAGKRCVAVDAHADASGECVIMTSGSNIVSISSVGHDPQQAYDLAPLIASLAVQTRTGKGA